MGGDMGDAGDGTRWMTYAELAATRGISKASANRLTFRKKWPRKTGNDNQARVAVPSDAQAPPPDGTPDAREDATHDDIPVIIHDMQAADTLARERQRADQAEARAMAAEAQVVAIRAQADQRGEALTAALVVAASAEAQASAEAARAALAESRLAAAEAALVEARLPWVVRVVRGFRGRS